MTDMRGFLAWLENGFTGLRRIQSHLPPQTTTSPMRSEIWPRTFLKITRQGKQKQRMWNHAQERLPQDLRKKTFYWEIWTSTDFHSPLYRLRRARHRTKRNGLSNPNARWKRVAEMPAEHDCWAWLLSMKGWVFLYSRIAIAQLRQGSLTHENTFPATSRILFLQLHRPMTKCDF